MTLRRTIASWLWKIPVCGLLLTAGGVLGGAAVTALGLQLPRMPADSDPGLQTLLLFLGGTALALGLAALAVGLAGRWWERWAVLAAFVYVVYGIGNALEAGIFTTLGGELAVLVIHLPATLLCALAVSLLFPGPSEESLRERAAAFVSRWRVGSLAARLALGVLAFPLFYLLFGMLIAPIVTPHYERLDFLVLPSMPTILKVLFLRSTLFLLVSLPLIIGWRLSRGRLILGLGLGHFVAAGLAGLIQVTSFPVVLRWTHGIEILADSMCYAGALAWLFLRTDEGVTATTPTSTNWAETVTRSRA